MIHERSDTQDVKDSKNEEFQSGDSKTEPERDELEKQSEKQIEEVGKNDENYLEKISESQTDNHEIPKMKSRFGMSNQQIRDLIDPSNQLTFNDNITRINHFLVSAQTDYCEQNFKEANQGAEFRLRKELLEHLVYDHELDLAGNFLQQTVGRRLNDADMSEIADFLLRDTDVTTLSLPYNDFSDEGAMILAGVLLIRSDISHINLAHNNLTPMGCFHFIEYLMQRPTLHSLKLAGMKIGEEGFNGLICLVMCGRAPYDLDVSETDLKMASFQGLCTSWQAIDHDEDNPKFLTEYPLLIPLGVLADMKVANNQDKKREQGLQHRRSLVELVANDGDGDGNNRFRMEKIPEIPKGGHDPVRLVENLSTTILKGLFEIPELRPKEQRSISKTKTSLDKTKGKVDQILKRSKELPDTSLIIKEFQEIKAAGCVPFDSKGNPVIVCPSFYSLDVDNVLQTDEENFGHFIPTPLDVLIEDAKAKNKMEGVATKAPDDETAKLAANEVVNQFLEDAALFSSTTEYEEKSDTAQLLLSVVLDTCQKLVKSKNSKGEFHEEDLEAIWENATQNAADIFRKRIPQGRCTMTQDDVMSFVRKFMESTNRTLLALLQNPFIPPMLFDVGTRACLDAVDENKVRPTRPLYSIKSAANLRPNYVQKIVMNFLDGAMSEAANIIGSGDPYSFRQNTADSLEGALQESQDICDETERHIEEVMNDFILAGSLLAKEANSTKNELELAQETTIEPASQFLEKTFDKVAELIIQTEKSSKAFADQTKSHSMKFAYISRPSRLVLNRPLFQDFEPIMASKMGDFLRENTSVKCLHMRKWNLGEDGMLQLMDGLIFNTNIVLLDLGSNSIGPEGTKCLAKFVKQNSNLKHLILNHNRLRNPGLTYLTQALPHSNLEFLNIAYNDISESLDSLLEILPETKIRALHTIGNLFRQSTWMLAKNLMDTEWLKRDLCDFSLQEVDGKGMIVKNAQMRDMNEWYDVPPVVPEGLQRAPYFEENAHTLVTKY